MLLAVVLSAAIAAGQPEPGERRLAVGSEPSLSQDGRRLLFQRTGTDGLQRVGVRDLASGAETWLWKGAGHSYGPSWGPNGEVVFTVLDEPRTAYAGHFANDERGGANLWVWQAGVCRQLTTGRHFDLTAAFSPVGNRVYFASTAPFDMTKPEFRNHPYKEGAALMALDVAEGASPKVLWMPDRTMAGVASPRLSPDGATLAMARLGGYFEAWRIVTAPVGAPSDLTFQTPETMVATAPAWRPDGKALAFTGYRVGDTGWSVYVKDLTCGTLTRICGGEDPTWSADGRDLVYVRDGDVFRRRADDIASIRPPTAVVRDVSADMRPIARRAAARPPAFEKIAILDTFDFAHAFDIETETGLVQVIEHVLQTGADRIIQRHHSGGLPRYPAGTEDLRLIMNTLDKRRLPTFRPLHAWLVHGGGRLDMLAVVNAACDARGVATGMHYTPEEAHNSSWSVSGWNLAHPQYWCRGTNGVPWQGHCSIAYPEVLAHKLAEVDEFVARGGDFFYVDPCRYGGWNPSYEHVEPVLSEWRRRFGDRPVPGNRFDPDWRDTVGAFQLAYFRGIRRRLDASGRRVRLVMGVEHLGHPGLETDGFNLRAHAIDWHRLRDEGVIDAVAFQNLRPDPNRLWEDTERLCAEAVRTAGLPVYFPILEYSFGEKRPSFRQYAKWAGVRPEEAVRRLLGIYRRAGAVGILMECVDYRNYSPEVCREIKSQGDQ